MSEPFRQPIDALERLLQIPRPHVLFDLPIDRFRLTSDFPKPTSPIFGQFHDESPRIGRGRRGDQNPSLLQRRKNSAQAGRVDATRRGKRGGVAALTLRQYPNDPPLLLGNAVLPKQWPEPRHDRLARTQQADGERTGNGPQSDHLVQGLGGHGLELDRRLWAFI